MPAVANFLLARVQSDAVELVHLIDEARRRWLWADGVAYLTTDELDRSTTAADRLREALPTRGVDVAKFALVTIIALQSNIEPPPCAGDDRYVNGWNDALGHVRSLIEEEYARYASAH